MKIRVFEAFAGYGSQSVALRNIGVNYEVIGVSEIDKYAIKAYMAIHGDVTNYGDIANIDWNEVPDFDLFTYSFPCTDISCAGKMKGLCRDSGTKSSLLWECEKAISLKRPKYLLMENVKALTNAKFIPNFLEWQRILSDMGYTNFTQILNAKDFNVPQSRQRVYMVSILGDAWYCFPEKQKLNKTLRNVLQPIVDDKYKLSDKMFTSFKDRQDKYKFNVKTLNDIAAIITTNEGYVSGSTYVPFDSNINVRIMQRSHGYNNGNMFDICPTITTNSFEHNNLIHTENQLRRLTPLEVWRLMGMSDVDFYKVQKSGISDTQLYKLAGNSIVVPVLEEIFKKLFKDKN